MVSPLFHSSKKRSTILSWQTRVSWQRVDRGWSVGWSGDATVGQLHSSMVDISSSASPSYVLGWLLALVFSWSVGWSSDATVSQLHSSMVDISSSSCVWFSVGRVAGRKDGKTCGYYGYIRAIRYTFSISGWSNDLQQFPDYTPP